MELLEFTEKYNNKSVDVDWLYGSQCVDLIKQYTIDMFWVTLWTFWWSAKIWWYNQANTFPEDKWEKIVNNYSDENQIPMPWDIIFWGYGAYWHVGIVTEAFKWENKIEVFNQNTWNANWIWYDDRCRYQFTNYNKCLWWYRFKENTELEELKKENKYLKEKLDKIILEAKY